MLRSPALLLPLLALLLAPDARALCDLSGLPPGTEVAELETPLGSLCIELLRDEAPLHVENFLIYLNNGLLEDTFFHRSVPGFIVQGGGFTVGATDYEPVPAANGTVTNEPCTLDIPDPQDPGGQICSERGNERGTVALAKVGGDPNSGSTNWFINLDDNRSAPAFLDTQNGGFTVFGRLVDGSIAVADAMAALPRASQDDLAWMESVFQTSPNFPVPLLQPPLDAAFGCWERSQESVLVVPEAPFLTPFLDPFLAGVPGTEFLAIASAGCGTPIPAPSSPADLPPDICASGLAIRITGPFTLDFPGGVPSYFALTCDEVNESFAQRALWLDAYRTRFNDSLVFIEAASVSVVPSPVPVLSPLAVVALGGLLLGAGLRPLRDGRAARVV